MLALSPEASMSSALPLETRLGEPDRRAPPVAPRPVLLLVLARPGKPSRAALVLPHGPGVDFVRCGVQPAVAWIDVPLRVHRRVSSRSAWRSLRARNFRHGTPTSNLPPAVISESSMPPLLVTQTAVALVWLYEGLWCKLLGGIPLQVDVVEAVPFFGRRAAVESCASSASSSAHLPCGCSAAGGLALAAAVQTALLVTMNGGGLFWARTIIPDPAGMVVKNFAFIVLAWVVAAQAAA